MMRKCPECGNEFESNMENGHEMSEMQGEEGDDSDLKKAVLDEILGMSNEERKKAIPSKKSAIAIDIMQMGPKKR